MINILFIGPFKSPVSFHKDYHYDFLPFISKKYNTYCIDTFNMHNKKIDIEKIVKEKFDTNNKTIIFFTAGPWLGNNKNNIKNHSNYYKLYDVWDQKINKQYNVILKPNKFNGFVYRYKSEEMDTLMKWTPEMDHYNLCFHCNENYFNNWNQNKIYDVLFFGGYNKNNYPLRCRLIPILQNLHNKNLIKFRFLKPEEGKKEKNLSLEINKAYLTVACKTRTHDRFLGKYQEIPFSYSCLLGNIPSRYRDLLEGNMIEVDLHMSDMEIANKILEALSNKKLILEKTEKLHNKFKKLLNYEQGKKDFESIIEQISEKL